MRYLVFVYMNFSAHHDSDRPTFGKTVIFKLLAMPSEYIIIKEKRLMLTFRM